VNAEIKQNTEILNRFMRLPRRLNIAKCFFVASFLRRSLMVQQKKMGFSLSAFSFNRSRRLARQ